MTEKQRKLIALQRRTLVLEDAASDEEDGENLDQCIQEFLEGTLDDNFTLTKRLKAGVFDRRGLNEQLDRTSLSQSQGEIIG